MDVAADAQQFLEEPTEYERGDVDAALEGAAHVVEAEYRVPAQLHNSMEPHCAVAEWRGEDLTIWSSTQAIYEGRAELARAFDIPAERVRVICEFMGGGFGSKFGVGPEGILAATLAQAQPAPRPAGLLASRGEPDGRVPDRGPRRAAGRRRRGRRAPRHRGVGRHGPGQRRLDVPDPGADEGCLQVRQRARLRASGRSEPGADRGLPRARRDGGHLHARDSRSTSSPRRWGSIRWSFAARNYVEGDQQAGRPYSSKNLLDCYDRAAELAGWADRDGLRSDGRIRRGMGMATQIWWGGGGPPAYAEVRRRPRRPSRCSRSACRIWAPASPPPAR